MSKKRITALAAGAVSSAVLLLSFFTPVVATASTGADGWIGYNTGAFPNGHQLGTYLPSGYGQRAVCIDISSPGNYLSPPTSITGPITNYDPLISWVLNNYSQSTDPAYTSALEYFVGVRINSNPGEIQTAWNQLASYNPTSFGKAQAALNDMTSQAASYAGPYTDSISMTHIPSGWSGAVIGVGVHPGGSGTWPYVPYTNVDLTLIGPAVFDQNGSKTISGITDGWGGLGVSGTSLAWHATGTGEISVSETIHGLALNYTLYPAPAASQQRMVTGAGTGDRYFEDPVSATAITPTVSSHLQHQLANGTWADTNTVLVNEKVRDTIQVSNGLADTTVNLDWSAQTSAQPFSASNTSGTVIASGTVAISLDASGAGSAILPFTIPVGYSGHVGVDTYLHGGLGVNDVDPPIFDNGESAPVVKWSPTVSSHLQKQAADGTWADADTFMVNEKARDTIQVINGMPNATVDLDWSAQTSAQPFSATNTSGDAFANGTISIILDAAGAGTAVVPFTVPVDYSGHVGVDTYLNGGLGANDVDPTIFAAGESAPFSKWEMAATSQLQKQQQSVDATWVNADTFMAGDQVRDVIFISGGAPNSPVSLDWELKTSATAFSKANVGTLVSSGTGVAITLDVSGAATYNLPVTTGPGDAYIGVDTYLHGLAQNLDVDPPVWDANESGLSQLWKPTATTLTSSIMVVSGHPISDQLKITGARPNTAFTCSATLYGPYETQQTEQGTVPADAVKAGTVTCSGTTDADGNATVNTVSLNAPAPGFYVWVGTLDAMKDTAGSPVAAAITEGFGIAAETSIVTVDTSGEASAGGIDGGIPASMPGVDLVWIVVLSIAMVGLGFAGAMRLRKVRPGPRRAYTD